MTDETKLPQAINIGLHPASVPDEAPPLKYPTPEDIRAYEEKLASHKILKSSEYIERYKANPKIETLNGIMNDLILELSLLNKEKNPKNIKTIFFGILNRQDEKWRAIVRRCGDKDVSPRAFEKIIYDQMPGAYIEWKRYRKLTVGRK
jgi:hypothetical protein